MAVKVRIPTPLRNLTGNQSIVDAQGATLREVIEHLEQQYAGIKEKLLDDNGQLRRFVNVFINDSDVRFEQGLDTPVSDGDEVAIVPAIAGGR